MVDDRGVIYEGARGWVSVGGDGPHATVSRWARVALLLAQDERGDGWVFAWMDGMDGIFGCGSQRDCRPRIKYGGAMGDYPTVILATAGIQGPQNEGIGNETGDFGHWIPAFAGMTEAGSGRSREAVVEMRLRWLRGAGPFGFPHVIASAAWQARRRSNDGSPAHAKPQRDCHVVRQAHHERLRSSQ